MSPLFYLFVVACATRVVRANDVPHYTSTLESVDTALETLKYHLNAIPSIESDPKTPAIQYLMIVNTINELVGQVARGADYNNIYPGTVQASILATREDPHAALDRIRHQVDGGNSKIAMMRDLIHHKQQNVCSEPNSRNCDMIINIAVNLSPDDLLKKQSKYLLTLGEVAHLFTGFYDGEFSHHANAQRAVQYLVQGQEALKEFVDSGVKAIKEGLTIDPNTALRFGYVNDDGYLYSAGLGGLNLYPNY